MGAAAVARILGGALLGTALTVYVGRTGSPFAVSLLATAFSIGMIIFAPIWGALADVTGRRRAILVGTGLGATAAVLLLLAVPTFEGAIQVGPVAVPGAAVPVGVRALYAVFTAGFMPLMLTVASERGGAGGRGQAVGSLNSFVAAGAGGGQFAAGILLGALAPSELYLVVAAVSLVATGCVAALDTGDYDPDPEADRLRTEVRRRLLPPAGERSHLTTNGLGWLYVGLTARQSTVSGVGALMPVYIVQTLALPEAWMGILLAFNPVSQTALMYYLGGLVDEAGRKPLVVWGMAGSAAFGLVAAAAVAATGRLAVAAVVAVAYVLLAVAFSAMWTGAVAFVGDVAPEDRESELMGLASTSRAMGGVIGPLFVGGVATFFGYPVAFVAASALALGAAALVAAAVTESRPAVAATPADD